MLSTDLPSTASEANIEISPAVQIHEAQSHASNEPLAAAMDNEHHSLLHGYLMDAPRYTLDFLEGMLKTEFIPDVEMSEAAAKAATEFINTLAFKLHKDGQQTKKLYKTIEWLKPSRPA